MTHNQYETIDSYLPHKAPMILLDRVISSHASQTICEVEVNTDGVLAPFLTDKKALPSWYFIELMAQTVGVWNGLRLKQHQTIPKIALLLGVRRFESAITEASLNDMITIEANMVLFDETLSSFQCSLYINGQAISSGNIVAYEATTEQLEIFKNKGSSL